MNARRLVLPLNTLEKLRIQLKKASRVAPNVELEPPLSEALVGVCAKDEHFGAKVVRTGGGCYWFSNRRVVFELDGAVAMQLPYHHVVRAHWMFYDLSRRGKEAVQRGEPGAVSTMKRDHFDRIELELEEGFVALDGLDQAYLKILRFFQWVSPG